MEGHQREVRNPLTNETVELRDFVRSFVGSTRLQVLRSLEWRSLSPADFSGCNTLTQQTASKHLTHLSELGLTKPVADGTGYELTAGGIVLLDSLEHCLETVDRDALTHLANSSHGLGVLSRLAIEPARPAALADSDPDSPSRTTVQRELSRFETENWCRRTALGYELTNEGEDVLSAYETLATRIERIIEKAPWFQRLDRDYADVPLPALEEATMYVSSSKRPGIFMTQALEFFNSQLERVRVLTPWFNPKFFEAYGKLWESGLAGEAIVDKDLFEAILEEGHQSYLDASGYSAVVFYRLEKSITLGVAIYDEETVLIGGYNEVGPGQHIAMIQSSNEELLQWGTGIFDSFRERAQPIIFRST